VLSGAGCSPFGNPRKQRCAIRSTRVPALVAASALAIGILVAARAGGSRQLALALLALAAVLAAPAIVNLVHGRCDVRLPVRALLLDLALLASVAATGGASFIARRALVEASDPAMLPGGTFVEVAGRAVEVRRSAAGRAHVVLEVAELRNVADQESRAARGRLWCSWPEGQRAPVRGDSLGLSGELRVPSGPRNPGAFDFSAYLAARGIHATLEVREARVAARPRSWGRVGERIARTVRSSLPHPARDLLVGLLLGRSTELREETLSDFRRSGTVHVLAVSGLHVGFVALFAHTVLRCLRVKPRVARLLALPCVAVFVLVIGARPSAMRAAVMAGCLVFAGALERRSSLPNALGFAAIVLLAADPGSLLSLGFQLSFAAVGGIAALFAPLARGLRRAIRLPGIGARLADAVALSLAAQAGVAPLLVHHFGEISIAAPLSNLAVVPLAAWSVACGAVLLLTSAFAPDVARIFAASAWASIETMRAVCGRVASWNWSSVPVDCRFAGCLAAAIAGLALAARPSGVARRVGRSLALAAAVGAVALTLFGPGRSYPRVVFFDVGQGDAALLEIPRRRAVLVDAGRSYGRGDCGRSIVVPYLRRRGFRRLDAIVVTHAHDDHSGGVASVIEAVDVGRLVLSGPPFECAGFDELLSAALDIGIAPTRAAEGDTVLAVDGARLVAVGPPEGWRRGEAGENDLSVVLSAALGTRTAILTGDIEARAERALLEGERPLAADLLKVAHHGSPTSSDPAFIEACGPLVAVVSVGATNRHGHPSPEVLQRLVASGAAVFRTDRDGAVVVDLRQDRIVVEGVASGRRAVVEGQSRARSQDGPTATRQQSSGRITSRAARRTSAGPIEERIPG